MADNQLFYGDNLKILREYIEDESVDLVYLDPPFKSDQNYNVLFAEKDGTAAAAQIHAFEDTWHWDMAALESFTETVEQGGDVSRALQAFRDFIGENDMLAYLSMMAPRLVELRRVLKPTGSLWLHCDPTASHYLKLLLDAVFGPDNFQNEIIWKRTTSHSDAGQCGRIHDVILFFSKSPQHTWNRTYQAYNPEYVENYYRYKDKDGRRFMSADLSGAGEGPPREFGSRGLIAPPDGRHWMYDQEGINRILSEDRIYWTKNGVPRLKKYLDEADGMPLQDVWDDVQALRSWHAERLGYPTQKPVALVERIIEASSNEGDVVLDPFCGCGTTIDAAQKLGRRWIGIDITHLAITLIKHRLRDTYGEDVSYEVHGEPESVSGAEQLAHEDRFQFQWWALGLVGARPQEQKKGADKGIDGRIYFHDEHGGKAKQIIISVKSGKPKVSEVRDLIGVLDREKAQIGVYITLQPPTGPMKKEATNAGYYEAPGGKKFARLQILTVEDLLDGEGIDYWSLTGGDKTFKKAKKHKEKKHAHQTELMVE